MFKLCKIMLWYSFPCCINYIINNIRSPNPNYIMYDQGLSRIKSLCKDSIERLRWVPGGNNFYLTWDRPRKKWITDCMGIFKNFITTYYRKWRIWVKVNLASNQSIFNYTHIYMTQTSYTTQFINKKHWIIWCKKCIKRLTCGEVDWNQQEVSLTQ